MNRKERFLMNKFHNKNIPTPTAPAPEQFCDCSALQDLTGECRALSEKMCVTRGNCKFYKPRLKEESEE